MSKALERPAEWHRQRFISLKETQVKCYLVFQQTSDGEEYNCFFPLSKKGYAEALKLVKKLGQSQDSISTSNQRLEHIVPYHLLFDSDGSRWLKWCKDWGVKL